MVTPLASTETYLSELAAATQRLTALLSDREAVETALQIRLATKPNALLVLAEHHSSEHTDQQQLLKTLEAALRSLLAELPFPDTLGQALAQRQAIAVRVFLRHLNQPKPYKAHSFKWRPSDSMGEVFGEASPSALVLTPKLDPAHAVPGHPADSHTDSCKANGHEIDSHGPESHKPESHGPNRSDDEATAAIALYREDALDQWSEEAGIIRVGDWAEPLSIAFPPANFDAQRSWLSRWQQAIATVSPKVWAGIAGGFTVAIAGFALSRPCVIGSCPRLANADALNQAAMDSLAAQPDAGAVLAAHADVQQANQLLETIPVWSRHYGTAQGLLRDYQDETALLSQIIAAQQSATEAAEKSQNPPHPVPQWIEIRLLWQRAIAQLQQLSAPAGELDPALQTFITQKLREYQANLEAISDRITAEQAADDHLNNALQAGQVAQHHTENAESFQGWQLAYQEWENSINFLQRIPQGTLAYSDAQNLLKDYRGYLGASRDRIQNEQQGDAAYAQAISAAQKARQFEQQSQWTLAVQQWQQALGAAGQVPRETALAGSAQALLDPYRSALTHAREQLREAIALQDLSTELTEICGETSLICRHGISNNQLQITVNPGYDTAIDQAMSLVQPTSESPTFTEPARQLLQQIATLGNETQRDIAIYDVQGVLIVRYVPRYGGFIKS